MMKKYEEFLDDKNPQVILTMEDDREITIQLFPSVAPVSVENFLSLVDDKFYDGIIFHRVLKGFVIQAGDPTGTGTSGSENKIKGEFRSNGFKNDLMHTQGVLSMARTNDPNSASSQFFIMHDDATHLDGSYAGFGVVTDGLDVVLEIGNTKTFTNDKPLEEQKIKSIRRLK